MSRRFQIAIGAAILVVFAVVIYAVLPKRDGGPKPSVATKAPVRLAWVPGATFAGDYVAMEKGYWKEGGLEVVVNPGSFEHDAIKLVASGPTPSASPAARKSYMLPPMEFP